MYEKRELFEFMLERIKETHRQTGLAEPQAFGKWFLNMFFLNPQDVFISDGTKDGKVDIFFTTHDGKTVKHHVLNTKFTREYNKVAPAAFYEEIMYFWQAFENTDNRDGFLEKTVKPELRARYRKLLERYDEGETNLMFVTNHRVNDDRYETVKHSPVQLFHLDNLIQHLVDDIDAALPRTQEMVLTGISSVLSPDKKDTEVSTSIVFARLIDFIQYMQDDPYELLFARNVRLSLGNTAVNKEIRETFAEAPKEFAFSNNGITMLCEKHVHDPGSKELTLQNPRVVNGSQTLHSIRDVKKPSYDARVMLRIIEIPPLSPNDLSQQAVARKEVINKISVRSNQQNPIKRWNLVAADDYQLELYRYFRRKGLFYERRDKEWNYRSRQLKSVGVRRGPTIKSLTPLIASYYWDKPQLGPAYAR
jgi:hypothetical protein